MTFYERYARICAERGIDPCSQQAADMLDTTRATISIWGTKKTTPKGETVARIADVLHVSADYLLGRTDDPTDYADPDLTAEQAGPVLDAFGGDVKQAVAFHAAVDADARKERDEMPQILQLYYELDTTDQVKASAYIEGLLAADKYAERKKQA